MTSAATKIAGLLGVNQMSGFHDNGFIIMVLFGVALMILVPS
jgi:hypothetical protein